MSVSHAGLIWCAVFVVLDAAQAVLFGSFLQRQDSFLIGFLVFGLSSLVCALAVLVRSPHEMRSAFGDPSTLIALNVSSAGGWLTYLGAIQLIEPAVAFTIFSGVIPLMIRAYAGWGGRGADTGARETGGFALLALGLCALGAATLAGWSGFVRGGVGVAVAGLLLAILSGVFMAAMLLTSYRLSARSVGPAAVFALRFPLYLLLAGLGWCFGFDDKGAVSASDLAAAVVTGLVVLAFPIYAVQKAVSLTPAATVGAATALIPVIVFLMQMLEGRVDYARATLIGLAIYMMGALLVAGSRTGRA
jgi:drug/metabolite transporter (DMT)-like permease